MSSKKGKLDALQRSYEVEERNALRFKSEIEVVVDQRRRKLEELILVQRDLETELKNMRTRDRASALVQGDSQQLLALSKYQSRLSLELKEASLRVDESRRELAQAEERVEIANNELVAARIEKKKLEKFIKQRAGSKKIRDAAAQELDSDESGFFRRKGK